MRIRGAAGLAQLSSSSGVGGVLARPISVESLSFTELARVRVSLPRFLAASTPFAPVSSAFSLTSTAASAQRLASDDRSADSIPSRLWKSWTPVATWLLAWTTAGDLAGCSSTLALAVPAARRDAREFDALSDANARTAGPSSDRALESRRYAALCRANLGQNTVALDQFRRLLEDVANADSHASELALDIRHSIGMLLLSAGDKAAAENVFESLYQDHLVINGPDDERTREIADILTRIRLPTSP